MEEFDATRPGSAMKRPSSGMRRTGFGSSDFRNTRASRFNFSDIKSNGSFASSMKSGRGNGADALRESTMSFFK